MRGTTLTRQSHEDPHRDLLIAVVLLAVEDATKRGDVRAWRWLWQVAPDWAAALWDRQRIAGDD